MIFAGFEVVVSHTNSEGGAIERSSWLLPMPGDAVDVFKQLMALSTALHCIWCMISSNDTFAVAVHFCLSLYK